MVMVVRRALDPGEVPLATAPRELEEEAGVRAGDWQPLGRAASSPGIFTEIIHLYLTRDLTRVSSVAEEHEVFDIHWRPWAEALAMAQRGDIEDARTRAGLLRAASRL